MTSAELDNLVRIGKLKRERPSARELQGLRESALARLADFESSPSSLRAAATPLALMMRCDKCP